MYTYTIEIGTGWKPSNQEARVTKMRLVVIFKVKDSTKHFIKIQTSINQTLS